MGRGTFLFANADHPSILSYWREYYMERVLVVINLSGLPQKTKIDLGKPGFGNDMIDLLSHRSTVASEGYLNLQVQPYDYLWLKETESDRLELVEKKMVMSQH